MRELSATMASTEAIDEATFADYKRKVADYLSGFWRELGQHADAIGAHVARCCRRRGARRCCARSPRCRSRRIRRCPRRRCCERQVALLRRQWAELSAWFGAGDSQLRSLDTHLHAAIDWILRGVRRLRERRVQRVNRSSEYRALAALFAGAPDEAGLPRDLRRRVRPARRAPHVGARARPGRRLARRVVVGRAVRARPGLPAPARDGARSRRAAPAPIADAREAQAMAMDEELRRRALVGELLDRLPAEPARLSALPALDEESFDLLLDALGMAVATGAVGYSDDGTLQLTVLDMGEELPPAAVRVGDGGVLESPDLLVQVGPRA